MTASTLPILPTTVVGSYAIPAWLWAAYEKIEAGGFGAMDVTETENDAVATAIRDQEHAGGRSDLREMRRQGFIVSIFDLQRAPPVRPRRKSGRAPTTVTCSTRAGRAHLAPALGTLRSSTASGR